MKKQTSEALLSGFQPSHGNADGISKVENWTFHDIRRSIATHMAQSGVIQEHIERVLAHVISGVAGTYNRYSYFSEKLDAMVVWEKAMEKTSNI